MVALCWANVQQFKRDGAPAGGEKLHVVYRCVFVHRIFRLPRGVDPAISCLQDLVEEKTENQVLCGTMLESACRTQTTTCPGWCNAAEYAKAYYLLIELCRMF